MRILERLIEFANIEMEVPAIFSPFHLLPAILVVLFCVVLYLFFRDANDRTFRILIGGMFAVMFLFEVVKQLAVHTSLNEGVLTFQYNWNSFPFQLCSTPLYVLPFLSFLPDCRIRDFAASYTMTFALVGGIAVYLTPKTVFTVRLVTNIQTMVHHGIQIVTGVFTAIYYRRRINRRFFTDGVLVFSLVFIIANLLNTVGYDMLLANGLIAEGDSFNMFYISPRADQTFPMCNDLLKSFPPIVCIVGYFVIVTAFAFVIARFVYDVYRLSHRRRELRLSQR